jgi:hypothetical protein
MAQYDYKNLRQVAALSPEEEARDNNYDQSDLNLSDLDAEIRSAKTPAIRAILTNERSNLGRSSPPAAPSRPAAPDESMTDRINRLSGSTVAQNTSDNPDVAAMMARIGGGAPDPAPSRTWGETASDSGIKLAQGVAQGLDSATGLVNLATFGGLRKAQKAMDLNPDAGTEIVNEMGTHLSSKQQEAEKNVNDAKGFVGSAKALFDNPLAIAGGVLESIPTIVLPFGAARGAMGTIAAGAAKKALAGGATAAEAAVAARTAVESTSAAVKIAWASHAGEGAESAGQIAQSSLQTDDTDTGKMYWGVPAGIATAVIGRLAGKVPGFGDAEAALFSGNKHLSGTGNYGVRVGKATIQEGAFQELPQSAQEQVFTNASTDKPLMEGVSEAGAQGLVVGGAMGGLHAGLHPLAHGEHATTPPASAPGLADQVLQATEAPAGPTQSQDHAAHAFADVGGDQSVLDGQQTDRGHIALSLQQIEQHEGPAALVKAIEHLSGGDAAVAEKLYESSQDKALISQATRELPNNTVGFIQANNAIRQDSGLMEGSSPADNSTTSPTPDTQTQQTTPQVQPVNPHLQSQVTAARDGLVHGAVVSMAEAQQLDLTGLQHGVATAQDGTQVLIVARDAQTVQKAVQEASQFGIEKVQSELQSPVAGNAVVRRIGPDGAITHEQGVAPHEVTSVPQVDGTTTHVVPVQQALQDRASQLPTAETQQAPADAAKAEEAPQPTFFKRKTETAARPLMEITPTAQTGAATHLVDLINQDNRLTGDQAVDPASIQEVAPDKSMRRVANAVQAAFGTKLVFIHAPNGLVRNNGSKFNAFAGAADRNTNTVYINAQTTNAPLNILGHELAHQLQTLQPEIFEKLAVTVLSRMRLDAAQKLQARLTDSTKSEGANPAALQATLHSELVAEGIGEMAEDPQLWVDVFGHIGEDQTMAKVFYQKVLEIIAKLQRALTNAGFISGIKDVATVKKAVVEAYKAWAKEYEMTGENPANLTEAGQEMLHQFKNMHASDDKVYTLPERVQKVAKTAQVVSEKPPVTNPRDATRFNQDEAGVNFARTKAPAETNAIDIRKAAPTKNLTIHQVAAMFDKAMGGARDFNDAKEQKRATKQLVAELQYQMQQAKSGLDWYEEDIKNAFETTAKVIPALHDPAQRQLFSVIAGLQSPGTNARDNWALAGEVFTHYKATGTIPGRNPKNGNLWAGGPVSVNKEKALNFLDAMVKDLKESNAIEWLMSDHSVRDLNAARMKWGKMGPGVTGKQTDTAMGVVAFGPKVGPFVMNINGIHEITVDVWATRTFNRYFGTMLGADGKITDAPTEPQRRVAKEIFNEAASQLGIKSYQVQSVIWFFEQQLFNHLGTGTVSHAFSDGAAKFVAGHTGGIGGIQAPVTGSERSAGRQPQGGADFAREADSASGTNSGQVPDAGRLRGSDGVLAVPRRPYSGAGKAGTDLQGLPAAVTVDGQSIKFGGFLPAQQAARQYMAKAGLNYTPQTVYSKVDPERATRIAQEFEAMKNDPSDPEVKASYDAMVKETLEQYKAILATGLKVEFNSGEDPYGNPRNAILDVVENNHLYIFSTKDGFGSSEIDVSTSPMLAETEFKFGDQPALVNDIFRVTHDYFGHIKEGVGFRADGEENAWKSHSSMYSDLARRAATTETRGQNSWVNYGPNAEANRTASGGDTVYAPQKVGLLPEWVSKDGAVDAPVRSTQQTADQQPVVNYARNPLKMESVKEALDFTSTGDLKMDLGTAIERNAFADAIVAAKNPAERKAVMQSIGETVIEKLVDSRIKLKNWALKLPASISHNLQQRLVGDLYRSDTVRSDLQKEIKEKFGDRIFKAITEASKASKMSTDQTKKMVGYWMSARYTPEASAQLIVKDRTALLEAQAKNDPALIALAQKNLQDRILDVNGAIGQVKVRGVAGGMNNAEAAQMVKNVESKIDPALLQAVAAPTYEMLDWKKQQDIDSGKVMQSTVNSWLNSPLYVPLTGDPRADRESMDVFSSGGQINQDQDKAMNGRKDSVADDGIDAAYEATIKSINFAAMQDFKRSLASTYDAAKAAGDDIGLTREPVTGIVRTGDDVIIHRDTVQGATGPSHQIAHAYRFADNRIIEAIKKDNEEITNSLLKIVAAPTRWYARAVTQFMPMFAPINFVRDIWERSELMRTRPLYDSMGMLVNTDKAARWAIADTINLEVWQAAIGKSFHRNWANTGARGDLEEMLRLGGSSTWGDYLDRSSGGLEASIRTSGSKLGAATDKLMFAAHGWNSAFELVPSLSIYRALKQQGVHPKDAAASVLDLMNFRKKGTMMPAVKALYIFSQPAAASGHNLLQYLSTTKGKIRFTAQALLATGLYAMLKASWGDDEDPDLGNKLDNMSNYTVERSIPIKMGDMNVKVPVGFGPPQMAWMLGGIINRWMSGRYNTVDAMGEIGKGFLKNITPVAPSDIELSQHPVLFFWQTLMPTMLKPVFAIGSDTNSFGSPLTPSFKDKNKLKADQVNRTTPGIYSDISHQLHEMTGIDMYPDHVKALVDGYLVGPPQELLKMYLDNPAKVARGEPERLPLIASLIDNINDRSVLNSIYSRVRNDMDQAHREFATAEADPDKKGDITDGQKTLEKAYQQFSTMEKIIGGQRSALRKNTTLDDDTRSERTQMIEERADEQHRRLLGEYFRSMQP